MKAVFSSLPGALITCIILHPQVNGISLFKKDDQRVGQLWLTEDVYQGSTFFE